MKTRSLVMSIMVIAVVATTVRVDATQEFKERIIERLPVERNEPIAITDIKVDGQSISLDKKFRASDEWLRSLVISIENKSDKVILFASIRLQFPRPPRPQDPPVAIYDMSYGNWALQTRRPTSEEVLVGASPGEVVEIRLSPQQSDGLRGFLTATNYPSSIEKVDLSIGHVIFADDTMWYASEECRRDSNDPSRWINSRYANSKPQ
jgi:hypothetical protein